jgi:hypothetical protein
MYLTRGGSVQRLLTSGPRGDWPADPTLQPLACWLHGDTIQEAVIGNPKPRVGGGQTPWPPGHVARPTGHVARPTGHHLVSY